MILAYLVSTMNRELFLSSILWLHRVTLSTLDELQKTMSFATILETAQCCFECSGTIIIFSCETSSQDCTLFQLEILIGRDEEELNSAAVMVFKFDNEVYIVDHRKMKQIVFPKPTEDSLLKPYCMMISWPNAVDLRIWLLISNDLSRQILKSAVQTMHNYLTSDIFRHNVLTSEEETPNFSSLTPPTSDKLEEWNCCSIMRRIETLVTSGPRLIEECGELLATSVSAIEKEAALTTSVHIDEILHNFVNRNRDHSNMDMLFRHVDNVNRIFRESIISAEEYNHIYSSLTNSILSVESRLNALLDEYCSQKTKTSPDEIQALKRSKDEIYDDIDLVIKKIKYLEETLCLLRSCPQSDSGKPFTFS